MKQTIDWLSYWSENRLGFHEGQVNSYLKQFLPLFNLSAGDSVFMPLCGKAVDILWLAQQGYQVIGVEISEIAIQSFFKESGLNYERHSVDDFEIYQSQNITLYRGDFMRLHPRYLDHCKLVYDRASIVAIEPFNRESYTQQMLNIIPEGIPMLVVTLDYDQSKMAGPPFSVSINEIRGLYQSSYLVEHLHTSEQIDERPRWRELGLRSFQESALRLLAI